MAEVISQHGIFESIKARNPISISMLIGFFALLSILIWLGVYNELGLYILPIILGILWLLIITKHPKLWLYSIPLLAYFYFFDNSEGVTLIEAVVGFYFLITLFVWMFWLIVVKRKKIIENIPDALFLTFCIFLFINSIITVANDVPILDWGRESSNIFLIGLYFPIRYYLKDKRDLKIFLIILAIASIAASATQIRHYLVMVSVSAIYAYQLMLGLGIQYNQTFFTSASVFAFGFGIMQRNIFYKIILVSVSLLSASALITTFSRTFWVILLIDFIVLFIYSKWKEKLKIVIYSSLIAIVFTVTIFTLFPNKADMFVVIMEKRLFSASKGISDISVKARISESKSTLAKVEEYPLGGNGLAKPFAFYDPITMGTLRTMTIHNGYIFLAYRMGIPMAILFLIVLIINLFKAEKYTRKSKDHFYRTLSLCTFCTILLLVMADFTSSQFYQRSATFVLAMSYAFVGIAEYNYRQQMIEEKLVALEFFIIE